MDILYQFNNNYAIYAGVSIISLFENNKNEKDIVIHILDDMSDPISDINKNLYMEIANKYERTIIIYDTHNLVALIKDLRIPTYRNCYAANMRLFLDKIIPDSVNKILYLDADTIITGSLNNLYSLDLGNKVLGMALECQGNPIKSKIGLKKDDCYYNSGVILYDLAQWRAQNCSISIINHAKNVRSKYISPDQDLLNVALRDKIKLIDLRYNYQPFHYLYDDKLYKKTFNVSPYYSLEELRKARNNICIIHCYRFMGNFPWHKNSNHPNEKLWDSYLAQSPWKNFEKIESNEMLLIRMEKILKKLMPSYFFLKSFITAQKIRMNYLEFKCKKTQN